MRLSVSLAAAALVVAVTAPHAWAIGETITDIRVQNNARTLEETVRSISGINIGEALDVDTLDKVRERLHTAGLFADVNVYWEPFRDGVRVVIVVKDKFPWAPVPTFSYSKGNTSAGLLVGHGNLFGRGKRGVVGGRYSTADSGGLLAYDDPALFGSWGFWTFKGRFQDQILPEFSNNNQLADLPTEPIRETRLRQWGLEVNVGVAWFRKVRTSLGYFLDSNRVLWSRVFDDPDNPYIPASLPQAAESATRGGLTGNVTFDFRAREHAVMYGNALSFSLDYGGKRLGSDQKIDYWKAAAQYEQGIRFFRKHNLVVRAAGYAGNNMPFWAENATTGTNLRGFVYRQYMGDTHLRSQVEYHFPLFSIKQLDVRGVVFNDGAAIWYRKLPPLVGNDYETRRDGRTFLPSNLLLQGFDPRRDVHFSAGAGLRFFLRSVSVPLVGVDFARGLEKGNPIRIVLVVGA